MGAGGATGTQRGGSEMSLSQMVGGVGWGWPMAALLVVFSVPPSLLQRHVSSRVSGPGGSVNGFCGNGGEL